jgi:hypothetical protein
LRVRIGRLRCCELLAEKDRDVTIVDMIEKIIPDEFADIKKYFASYALTKRR